MKVKLTKPLPTDPALLAAVDALLARPEQGMPALRTSGLARFQTAADYDCVKKKEQA